MVRYITSVVLGGAVAFALFFLMYEGIKLGGTGEDQAKNVRLIDFVRVKRASETKTKKRELPKKQRTAKQPKAPSVNMPSGRSGGPMMHAVSLEAQNPAMDRSLRLAGGPHLGGAPSDQGHIPLVRIQPMYPRSAAERRIEGWVLIQFTISITGSVKNPRVLKAQPPNIFNRAALQAIRKWKYKPTIKNGVALETPGVRVKLTFELDKQ